MTSAVADKLRDQIIRGEIPEGTVLRQDLIASQCQVSRIPVREALRQLDAEGLVSILPNRGALVPQLSPGDVEELFRIRALLEPEVLKASIPNLTAQDLDEAAAILRNFAHELRLGKHLSGWGRLNWHFHSKLYSRAGRPHFLSIIQNINNKGERYTRLQLYLTDGMKRANEEHAELLRLCRARNTVAAGNLLRRHIQHAGQSLKQCLQNWRSHPEVESRAV